MDVPSYLENMICFLVQHIQTFHPPICREPRCLRRNFQEEKTFDGTTHPFQHRSSCIDRSRHRISAMPLSVHLVINLHLCACPILLTCRRDKANKGRDPKQGGISVHYGMTVYRIRWPDLQSEHAIYFTKVSLQRCQVLPSKLLK